MSVNKTITAEQWVKVKSIVSQIIELPNDSDLINKTIDDLCEFEQDIKPTVTELVSFHFNSHNETMTPQRSAISMIADKDDIKIGQHLSKYKIIDVLGQGGMGKVYLARREDEIHKNVAIKVIDVECIDSQSFSRFDIERRVLAGLEHPNITRLLDAGKIENKAFYIMEYVDGVPIDEYCDENQLNLKDRLELFLKVCEAVSYAHRNLIVHRDLKPSNILVNKEGEVKLLDFGIAKPLKQLAGVHQIQETQIGTNALTPQYASPEQLNNDSITVMCDVYQLGLLLYRLLTREHAFDFTNKDWNEIHRIINSKIPELPSKRLMRKNNHAPLKLTWQNKLKGDLDTIIHHTLKKKPSDRYQGVDELVKDINRYLNNEPIQLKSNIFSYRFGMFLKKYWLPLSAVTTVFMLLVLSVWMISNQRNIAVQEMQKAAFLSDTFIKAFKSADPAQSNGVNLTAIDIVKQTQKIIQSDEKVGSETVKAELVLSIAEVYRNLGDAKLGMEAIKSIEPYYDLMSDKVKSKYYAERLMASFKNSLSTDSIMTLIHESSAEVEQTPELLFVHAYLYRQLVQDRKAEIAINTYYQELESNNELYFPSCALLGHIKLASTQFEEAKNILEGCLSKTDVNDGNAWEVSEIYFILGRLYIAFEDGEKAIDRLLKAKDIRAGVVDVDHMEIGNIDIFLSDAYLLHRDYEKAKYHADQALQIRTNYFMKNKLSSNGLFKPIFRIANYYKEIGEFAKAKEKYEEVIRMRTESGAKFAFNTGVHFLRYGVLLCEMKLTEQALQAFDDAISVFMQPKYNDIEYKTMVDIKMAECFDSQGNQKKALELMKQAIVQVNIHFKPYQSIYKQAQELYSKLSSC